MLTIAAAVKFLAIFACLRDAFTSLQPFVVVFNGIMGLIISAMTLYLLIRTRPRKVKTEMLEPGSIIINWTGHPLPQTPWSVPFKVWEPKTPPNFNVESWDTIRESVSRMLYELPQDLQTRMLQGNTNTVIIAIPQLAAGLSVLLAAIHGITGVFPTITSPLRKADGSFWLPPPMSLSDIRLQSRSERGWGKQE